MNLIDNVKSEELQNIRFVLTDMDETLTYKGRLQARTYLALRQFKNGPKAFVINDLSLIDTFQFVEYLIFE